MPVTVPIVDRVAVKNPIADPVAVKVAVAIKDPIDDPVALLTNKLEETKITEYTKETAHDELVSALDQIENEERNILKRINADLLAKAPFVVVAFVDEGVSKCVVTMGSRLIEKIEQECSEGSVLMIDGFKTVVEKMTISELIVRDTKKHIKTGQYPVEFIYTPQNRKPILKRMNISLLFPPTPIQYTEESDPLPDLEVTKYSKLNEIQKGAIQKALHHVPESNIPFLVRGPPGTGKTTTLVEFLLQIIIKNEDSLIIVCTPSNRAADNVIEKMPQEAGVRVLRMLSFTEELKLNTNKKLPGIDYKTTFSSNHQIVVCTIGMLHHLYTKGIPDIKPSHIIIDEASMVADTDMILVLGLLTADTTFVMFGDDKQLGPVVKVYSLKKSFLATSMFERILKDKAFEMASVCLLENYRSTAGIVAPFNKLFYDGQLISKVIREDYPNIYKQQQIIHQSLLPDSLEESTGVYFQCVRSRCTQQESKSWKNYKEVMAIVKIVTNLIFSGIPASEIGIITPYTDQVRLIRQFIDSTSVVIGSVDSFQGQERNVIIVSTVRSFNCRGIGFVGDKKRLNVTLSRAKAALIIIGNDVVLKRKKIFKQFFKIGGIHFIK